MKKIHLSLFALSVLIGCSKTNENPATTCQVNGVTLFDEASTRFTFAPDGNDGYQMTTIVVYENTDSSFIYSYVYNGDQLLSITTNESGSDLVYNATYTNNKLTKLSTDGGANDLAGDIILNYSGDNVTAMDTRIVASDGNLYQVGEIDFTYNGSGDLTKSEIKFDITALFTIAFGGVPDTPYNPVLLGSVEYEYGQDDAPNPLFGIYNMEIPDMGFMKNMPISIVSKDDQGNVKSSDSYSIEFNEFGYPVKSTSGNSYIEAAYDCQ